MPSYEGTPKERWFAASEDYWRGFIDSSEYEEALDLARYRPEDMDAHRAEAEERLEPLMYRDGPLEEPEQNFYYPLRKKFIYDLADFEGRDPFVYRDFWHPYDLKEKRHDTSRKVVCNNGLARLRRNSGLYWVRVMEELGMVRIGDTLVTRTVQRFAIQDSQGNHVGMSHPSVVAIPDFPSEYELGMNVAHARGLTPDSLMLFVEASQEVFQQSYVVVGSKGLQSLDATAVSQYFKKTSDTKCYHLPVCLVYKAVALPDGIDYVPETSPVLIGVGYGEAVGL